MYYIELVLLSSNGLKLHKTSITEYVIIKYHMYFRHGSLLLMFLAVKMKLK